MPVENIASSQRLAEILVSTPPTTLIVVDFTATWCGPCKAIAPFLETLATKYPAVTFIKVDVDQHKEAAQVAGVTAMPTFQFIKGTKKVDELKGANPKALEAKVIEHSAGTSSSNTASTPSFPGAPNGQVLLNTIIDKRQLSGLNAKEEASIPGIFEKEGASLLETDVDEQLILSIPFAQTVRLHSLSITVPKDKLAHGPKTLRLYANRLNLSFDEAEDIEPTQTITLTEKTLNSVIPLRFVKFQSVGHLVIFVVDNQGSEESTILSKVSLIGKTVDTTDMSQLGASDE